MPKYRLTVEGHDYLVEVPDPRARPVTAIVDGEAFEIQVVDAGASAPQAVVPAPRAEPPQAAAPAPRAERVAPAGPVPSPAPAAPAGGNGGAVTAPLPGTIVGISVSVGDSVSHGQELCVLEAMKMNNPIRATQPGIVKEILVNVGQQVQHGTPLMVVEEA